MGPRGLGPQRQGTENGTGTPSPVHQDGDDQPTTRTATGSRRTGPGEAPDNPHELPDPGAAPPRCAPSHSPTRPSVRRGPPVETVEAFYEGVRTCVFSHVPCPSPPNGPPTANA